MSDGTSLRQRLGRAAGLQVGDYEDVITVGQGLHKVKRAVRKMAAPLRSTLGSEGEGYAFRFVAVSGFSREERELYLKDWLT